MYIQHKLQRKSVPKALKTGGGEGMTKNLRPPSIQSLSEREKLGKTRSSRTRPDDVGKKLANAIAAWFRGIESRRRNQYLKILYRNDVIAIANRHKDKDFTGPNVYRVWLANPKIIENWPQ